MSKGIISRIVDALATRGMKCPRNTARFLEEGYRQAGDYSLLGSLESLSDEEICEHLVGDLHAEQSEWISFKDKHPPKGEKVIRSCENGQFVYFDNCSHPGVDLWLKVPPLPKPKPKCKLCGYAKANMHEIGVCCSCCMVHRDNLFSHLDDVGLLNIHFKLILKKYDRTYKRLLKQFGPLSAFDILLEMWKEE